MNTNASNTNVCGKCNKSFVNFYVLRKHVKKFHPEELEKLAPLKTKSYAFSCELCNKNFSAEKSLKWHLKTHVQGDEINNTNISVQNVRKKCPLCDFVSRFKAVLHEHFKVKHINVKTSYMNFSSTEQYNSWFSKIEKETQNKFVLERRSKSAKAIYSSFLCHRSGFFSSRGSGKRHVKTQGSKKINGYCPARIQVTIYKDCDRHKVSFVETHVGHQNDLCHLFLSDNERKILATKIAMKIPFDEILNDIRDTVSKNSMERIHLLTKKDLFNIEACLNLYSSSQWHKNDAVSVDAWVEEMKNSCILFYKPQGESTGEPIIENSIMELQIFEQTKKDEAEKMFNQIASNNTHVVDNNELRDKKKQLVENVLREISTIENENQFKAAEKIAASIGPTLRALENTDIPCLKHVNKGPREPGNKNIVQQRRLFSTKKRPGRASKKLLKPSESEKNEITLNLIL